MMRYALFFLLSISLFYSCSEDTCSEMRTMEVYTPVYMTKPEIRNAVKVGPIREVASAGTLYVYEDYLLIGDPKLGIHIYDNSDPKNPVQISFIEVEGNTKISVQNDLLYADNYVDLLVFDVSDMHNPSLVNNLNDVLMSHYAWNLTDGVVIDYQITVEEFEWDCNTGRFTDDVFSLTASDVVFNADQDSFDGGNLPNASNIVGVGGSLAKFTIAHNRLFVVDDRNLQVYDLSIPTSPSRTNNTAIGWGIETIFPYKDNLFIGSQSGMFIYSASDPDNPTLLSTFEHARNCDPVFATDDRAYVTLRDGNECFGFNNQLDVIDITSLTNPTLIQTFPMDNPHGLSVRGSTLFICEGDFGLKVFDRSDDRAITQNLIGRLSDIHAVDVISLADDHLLVIGQEGLYQMDASNPGKIEQLSLIAVNNQ